MQRNLMMVAAVLAAAIVVAAAVVVMWKPDGGGPGPGPDEGFTPDPNWTPGAPRLIPPIGVYSAVGTSPVSNYDDPVGGIYVSPTGNDATADGSVSHPYGSINTALWAQSTSPGSTIILREGVYTEGRDVRVTKSDITIKSMKGEWAVIDLTNLSPGSENSAVEFYAENTAGGVVSGCKLQAVEVRGGFYAVCFETKWEWGQADRRGVYDIIIEDCILHDSKNDVVKVKPNCDNITIRYCEIYNSGRAFVGESDFTTGERNSEGIDNVNGKNMHVHNNYIHDICSTGVYAKGGAVDCLIENNRIESTYGAGIMVGFDTSPQYFDTAVNPNYYENINGVVRNNLIIHTGWEGIGLYGSINAQVYNNTLVDVNYAQNWHSAIYFGLTYQDWSSRAGRPANVNPSIYNNIVSQPASFTERHMIEIRYSNDLGGMSALSGGPVMHDNCYFIAGKSVTFYDMRAPNPIPMDLAEWKTHISGDSGTIEADPGLDSNYRPTNPLCAGMGCVFS